MSGPLTNMNTLDEQAATGALCVQIASGPPGEVLWAFDDGTTITTSYDLSTREGQLLVAQAAEKLGFGHRRDLARILSAPIGPGPGVIFERRFE